MEKLAPPQMRCGVQRPSPLMNGHWGYDDRHSRRPPITSPEASSGGRRAGPADNGRETTTWPLQTPSKRGLIDQIQAKDSHQMGF